MEIPQSYLQENFLRDQFGNNAFDYQSRAEIHPEPYLRVAPLISYPSAQAALATITTSHLPAFELFENNRPQSFPGLQNFLLFPNLHNGSPIFIFDNHNHAFFFWHWYFNQNSHLTPPFPLLHIDQHKDTRIPATLLSREDSHDEKKLFQYTNEILNVGNFIPPAIKTGLIKDLHIVDSTSSLEKIHQHPPEAPFILDLDLDFFSSDLNYIDNQLKIEVIKKSLQQATITTIATSPYFLEHQLAVATLHQIFF